MKTKRNLLAVVVMMAALVAAAGGAPISATGWGVDFILGNGETYAAHQKPENANIWFAEDSTVGSLGLPASGAVTAAGVDYQFQSYTGGTNNVLRGPGRLTLDAPGKFAELSVLGSNTGGSSTATWQMTLNFSDAPSSAPIDYTAFTNWAGGTSDVVPNPQLTSNGTGKNYVGTLTSRSFDLAALGHSGSTLESIDFGSAGGAGGNSAIFALSGESTGGGGGGGPVQILGVTATATSELGGSFSRVVGNIVDNIELTTTDPDGTPGVMDGGMWLNNGTFTTPNDLAPEVVFDLGAVEKIAEMVVFNYNEAGNFTSRGVDELEILVSDDNFAGDVRSLGLFHFDKAPGTSALTGQLIDLGGVEAQFVKFDIASNHGGDNNFVGLNEVQFFRASAGGEIPEPATMALLSLAACGLGGYVRRRRRA